MPDRLPLALRACAGAAALLLTSLAGTSPAVADAGSAPPPPKFSGGSCIQFATEGERATRTPSMDPWWQTRLRYHDLAEAKLDGRGVTIAVIDTAVDIEGTWFLSRDNVTVEDMLPDDVRAEADKKGVYDCRHGTAVTALLVGNQAVRADAPNRNVQRVPGSWRGIAPGAKVVALRALATSDASPDAPRDPHGIDYVVAAIQRAIELKVDIISISQSAYIPQESYANAVAAAIEAGIVVVAAAGNDGNTYGPSLPAAYPGVIAVGMTTPGDTPGEGSGFDRELNVSVGAPGTSMELVLPGTWSNGAQVFETGAKGTSYATPLVAGTVALMLQAHPKLTPAQVKQRLELTADPPTAAVPDRQLGYGIINPYRAVMAPVLVGSPRPTPTSSTLGKPLPSDGAAKDTFNRDMAVGIAGASVALAGLALLLGKALPVARRRGFRAAERTDPTTRP